MLIDEFQDTNHSQYILAKLLVEKHRNICVVGDPDQSIYKFRGADIKNILEFENDFKNTKIIVLEQNYRSTATVLNAANDVISYNKNRKEKNLWTENDEGAPICVYKAVDEHDEAEFVIEHIREMINADPSLSLNDIVVFHRIHALSRVFEEHFRRARLPHTIVGDVGFYNRREIKDIVAYLRVIANQADDVNFRRIINTPHRGIGATTQETLARYARTCNITLFDAANQVDSISNLSKAARTKIKKFMTLMNSFCKVKKELTVTELVKKVVDDSHYIEKVCGTNDLQDRTRVENIKELISAAAEYDNNSPDEIPSVEGFLHEVALTSELDKWNDTNESITLMTIHNAKGLEFPVVYIVGMEENLFPHYNSSDDPTDIEEERRLCYVGMTRAKKNLSLLSVLSDKEG
jgi:DNA helicase-2/ATP-dependent DNA helicase PcrA